jgi:hypothetical protein
LIISDKNPGEYRGLQAATKNIKTWASVRMSRKEKADAVSQTEFLTRMQHLRAGLRLNSRVKLTVEWCEAGRTHQVDGYTIDISPKGCLAVVPQGFAVGQRMKLINSVTRQTCQALLIWRGHEGRAGWELGLELENADCDFWGLDF